MTKAQRNKSVEFFKEVDSFMDELTSKTPKELKEKYGNSKKKICTTLTGTEAYALDLMCGFSGNHKKMFKRIIMKGFREEWKEFHAQIMNIYKVAKGGTIDVE